MARRSDRRRVATHPRDAVSREWELFVREAESGPLRHVGSISAPSAEIGHEQAEKLFGQDLADIWLCPADAVRRYSTHRLAETEGDGSTGEGDAGQESTAER